MSALKFLTYLAPSIPRSLFEFVSDVIATRLGQTAVLECEESVSGPSLETDPFRSGRADFAFVCAPAYLPLAGRGSARLVPAALVPSDPRASGFPIYFADVVVRADDRAVRFPDLAGRRWTYNDPASPSGWRSMLGRLAELRGERDPNVFFSEVSVSGSHRASLEMVASGAADASAIDSNALALRLRENPELAGKLRVIETWGPLPIQPILASIEIPAKVAAEAAEALLELDHAAALTDAGFRGFARVGPAFYEGFPILDELAPPPASP